MRTLTEISDVVARVSDIYAARFGITRDAAWYLGKMTEEMGELQSAYLTLHGQGRSEETDVERRTAMEDEFADVLSMLLLFARWQDIDVAAAVDRKWGQYLENGNGSGTG